jgi:gamma-glutamylcyclotransferase (GGCT)/AIG2-like uncharacterized protein YtfP
MKRFPMHLFVYGTLMRGFCKHHLMKPCKFIRLAKTVDKYSLFTNSEDPFTTERFPTSTIFGELYTVPDQATLDELDFLEEHPVNYERRVVPIQMLGSIDNEDTTSSESEIVMASLYFNDNISIEGAEFIPSGRFGSSRLGQRLKTVGKAYL